MCRLIDRDFSILLLWCCLFFCRLAKQLDPPRECFFGPWGTRLGLLDGWEGRYPVKHPMPAARKVGFGNQKARPTTAAQPDGSGAFETRRSEWKRTRKAKRPWTGAAKAKAPRPPEVTTRGLRDTRIHPSRFRLPSSSFATYQPPTARLTYSAVRPQTQSNKRSVPQYSLFGRTPPLKRDLETPGPKYECYSTGLKRDGRDYVHGPRFYPEYPRFRKMPEKKRATLFDPFDVKPGHIKASLHNIGPGSYQDQDAFRKSAIKEPQYSWASRTGIKVVYPKANTVVRPGRKIKVRFSKMPGVGPVSVTLWRARKRVQTLTRSTSELECEAVVKAELPVGLYRFRVQDIRNRSNYAWSEGFQMELRRPRKNTQQRKGIISAFGFQYDSNKRSNLGPSFGFR